MHLVVSRVPEISEKSYGWHVPKLGLSMFSLLHHVVDPGLLDQTQRHIDVALSP